MDPNQPDIRGMSEKEIKAYFQRRRDREEKLGEERFEEARQQMESNRRARVRFSGDKEQSKRARKQILEDLAKDEELLADYGPEAQRAKGYSTRRTVRGLKRAEGGTATMPEDLGYMVGGAMKEKKRDPIKYAVGGAIKGKNFSGIF
tara:strand:- start:1600 stop:2040 length:441 start_codon:yes stop_codon:yes gene_type:complete